MSNVEPLNFMKYTSIMILCCALLIACAANYKTTKVNPVTPHFPVSNNTQLFLFDYNNEVTQCEKQNRQFTPSQELVNKYQLNKLKNDYCVFGFIKVDSTFSEQQFSYDGMIVNSRAGQIVTVQIPLKHLSSFLQYSGIIYFDIAHKMNINK